MKCLMTVAAAALALAAFAEEPAEKATREMRARPPRAMMGAPSADPVMRAALNPKLAEKLGLSEAQAAKLKALREDQGRMRSLHEQIRKGMERQTELLKAEKIDEAAVMAAIDAVFEARKAIAKEQTGRLIAAKAILTPEQIKQAQELAGARAARTPRAKRPRPAPEGAPAAAPEQPAEQQ
ncbi:MAG: Spy/CpxP family protein refolding chaperone [Kiritimatiellia bacterium]